MTPHTHSLAWVVVKSGAAAGNKIGMVLGPDKQKSCARTHVFVKFPGEAFPKDFRSIAISNTRPALPSERARSLL